MLADLYLFVLEDRGSEFVVARRTQIGFALFYCQLMRFSLTRLVPLLYHQLFVGY